jgi:hypothetical protein
MRFLKQNAATAVSVGPYVLSSDAVTPSTGLTPTIELQKTTGLWAARDSTGAITADQDGWYLVPLSSVDAGTLGPLMLKGTESGNLPIWHEFMVQTAEAWDQNFGTGNAVNLTTANLDSALTAYNAATSGDVDAALTAASLATMASLNALSGIVATQASLNALSGIVATQASLNTLANYITANVTTTADIDAALAVYDPATSANVDAALLNVLNTVTRTEPGQGAPASNAPLGTKIDYLFKAWNSRHTQDATTYKLYNAAGTVVDQKATVADDGTTFDRGVIVSGP